MQQNLALHHAALQTRTPVMRVAQVAGLQCVHSIVPGDTFNSVCPLQLDLTLRAQDVMAAMQWFAGAPFSWRVLPSEMTQATEMFLKDAGLVCVEEERAMWLDLALLECGAERAKPLAALTVHGVDTPEQVQQFADVVAANWEPEDPAVLEFYRLVTPAVLRADSPVRLFVGVVEGKTVCTAECCMDYSAGTAGLYNISTRKECRRQGYGRAIAVAALQEARRAGCTLAVLQASAQGSGLYAGLGFQDCGPVHEWQPADQASR